MIWACLLAFVVGSIQVFLIALQTRQLSAQQKHMVRIFVTSIGISSLWALGVHSVATLPVAAPFYVMGAALGTLSAAKLKLQ